jgi:glyoxylase-like metal-dependent hydrolase (beta-lactamase superfamily II)
MILLRAEKPSAWTGPTGNNTYLLPGELPTLIDAGVGRPVHLESIERELRGHALAQVLLTHGHPDHASGVPSLIARWPDVRVRAMSGPEPSITDGEIINAGDGALEAVATPGHAPDHCCLFQRASGDLFCGDLVRAGGTIVIAASRGGDLQLYLESLHKVLALRPRRLLPGHGPEIDDPASAIARYLDHRARRDEQVVEALREGSRTPEQIAARIYRLLDPSIKAAAIDTVLAHLIKLEREGRVGRVDDGWSAR